MTPSNRSSAPPAKRRKLHNAAVDEAESTSATFMSLDRPVSPPVSKRTATAPAVSSLLAPTPSWSFDDLPKQTGTPPQSLPMFEQGNQSAVCSHETLQREGQHTVTESVVKNVASPFQLTKIRDLAPHQNVDTIELKDILGHPMIKDCWNFNFLFDLDFVM